MGGSRESDGGGRAGLPEPSFRLLVASLAAQVQVALGLVENPITKKTERDLDLARHGVSMLEILETTTKGNLTPEDDAFLAQALYGLRMAYVKLKG